MLGLKKFYTFSKNLYTRFRIHISTEFYRFGVQKHARGVVFGAKIFQFLRSERGCALEVYYATLNDINTLVNKFSYAVSINRIKFHLIILFLVCQKHRNQQISENCKTVMHQM
jgi:hypothetical protein